MDSRQPVEPPPPAALPPLSEVLDSLHVVTLPMRTRFRGQTVREAALLQGPAGWGEFAPFPEYGAQEASAWLVAGVEAAWSGLGKPLRTTVPVNATLPAVSASEVEGVLARYGDLRSIPAVKIKVAEPGQNLEDDLSRFREVRRLVPHSGLRADANGAWTLSQAVRALEALGEIAEESFEYAEQPVAGVEPLAELRELLDTAGVPVRIAADEAVRKAEDPLRVAQLGAADLIVVKVPPLGGVDRALSLVKQAGLDAVVSSALDTSVGLAAGVALAARLPELPYACGLGTAALLAADVVNDPVMPRAGRLEVRVADGDAVEQRNARQAVPGHTAAGLTAAEQRMVAPQPAPDLLDTYRVSAEREAWWRERVRKCYEVLAGEGDSGNRAG